MEPAASEYKIKFSPFFPMLGIPVIIFMAYEVTSNLIDPKPSLLSCVILALFYCGFMAAMFLLIRMLSFLIRGIPAITLTKEAITLAESGYVIRWENIDEINYTRANDRLGSYVIQLVVRDPQKYIDQTPNKLQRFYRRTTFGFFHRPFNIGDTGLAGSLEKIFPVIDEYYQKYGNKNQ
jgi:hypothetical protein